MHNLALSHPTGDGNRIWHVMKNERDNSTNYIVTKARGSGSSPYAKLIFRMNLESCRDAQLSTQRICCSFPGGRSLVPSAHNMGRLTTTYNPNSQASDTPFWPPREPTHMWDVRWQSKHIRVKFNPQKKMELVKYVWGFCFSFILLYFRFMVLEIKPRALWYWASTPPPTISPDPFPTSYFEAQSC